MNNTVKKRKVARSEEVINNCLHAIRNGMAIKTACRRYDIPRSTIKFRLSKRYKHQTRPGAAPVLDQADELELVGWMNKMARKGYPVTKYRIMNRVSLYLEEHPEKNRFKTGKPSDRWYSCFIDRYRSELSIQKSKSGTRASANVTKSDIRKWFNEVLGILHEEEIADILTDPRRILNGDEACFYLHPTIDKVIARRCKRNVHKIEQGSAKENITVMLTCSADDLMFPPMVVLPYKKIPMKVTKEVPAEWGLSKTDSGWIHKECFMKYIKRILHPQLVKADLLPVVYFVDGHTSNTPWEIAEECSKLGIILVCMYANCTKVCQPLEAAVFKSLEMAWLNVMNGWKFSNPKLHVKTEHFLSLLKNAMESVDDRIVRDGFEACGLFPFDINSVDFSECLADNYFDADQNDSPETEDYYEMDDTTISHSKTFPVSHADAKEVLDMMGLSRRIRYRNENDMDFISEEDQILAKVYSMLKTLDAENEMIGGHFLDDQAMVEEAIYESDVEEKLKIEFVPMDASYEA
ncbi:uncharacterized protein LOC131692052 [Topomyia yanbarensis]|uniref:uncharacterized protein LOC131692052 n=1 Tax=Topomyia yanbarensis TaxID=2498891 RepID=UPI00273B3F32|nr:uncharacterized protein LOC131692052 [Topomyia yanbarensis]